MAVMTVVVVVVVVVVVRMVVVVPMGVPGPGRTGQGPDSLLAPPPAFAPLRHPAIGLYTVVDSAAWVDRVLAAGVRTVQLRMKDPAHPHLHAEIQQAVADDLADREPRGGN